MGSTALLTPYQLTYSEAGQWKKILKQAAVDHRSAIQGFLTEDMDAATQTVTVQIAIQEQLRSQFGPRWYDIPPIIRAPVVLPRAGGFSITLPLKKGTEGLLIFCDCCFDLWWVNGQNNAPPAFNLQSGQSPSGSQRQLEVRRHHIHDCVFTPGPWSQPNLLSNFSASSLQIRSDDGNTIIDVSESGVTITAQNVTVNASGMVQITTPVASVNATSGTPQKLMTDGYYQYWETNILPFLQSKGYSGPSPPTNSETTVLKGQ